MATIWSPHLSICVHVYLLFVNITAFIYIPQWNAFNDLKLLLYGISVVMKHNNFAIEMWGTLPFVGHTSSSPIILLQ